MPSVRIVRNTGLPDAATGVQTSNDNEPTAASFLNQVFATGNFFASHSTDGGASWTFVDPFTAFPFAAGGFCCDQMTLHERSRNLWVWVLQYATDPNGRNVFRLAVSTNGTPGSFVFWDFSPGTFSSAWATNHMFDRPDIATANNNLYISYNVYQGGSVWQAALVFKISLDGLANHVLNYVYYTITTHGALCLARGATTEMFWMGAVQRNPVRIFRWPDGPGAVMTSFEVSTPGTWIGSLVPGTYSSPGPGGAEWLRKLDSRPTAGWVTGNRVGFMWHALPNPARPQPWVKAIVVDANTRTVVAEPDLWNPGFAWAYPSTCPSVNGTVGLSVFMGGGGSLHPRHVVGFLSGSQWVLAATRDSTNGPFNGVWGDYVSCATHDPNATEWVATGFTLQGGTGLQAIEPQYVQFGVGP
jgi:hypothetical protein